MVDMTRTEQVAERVRRLRAARGWTAQDLADACADAGFPALTRSTIAKIESGVRVSVSADELAALAAAFKIDPADLLAPQSDQEVLLSQLNEFLQEAGRPSLREISKRTGIPLSSLSGIVRGRYVPPWEVFEQLVVGLGGSPTEFLEVWERARYARHDDGRAALGGAAGHETVVGNAYMFPLPHQLPPGARPFVGREEELSLLETLLTSGTPETGAPTVLNISGLSGVGKTALAVQAAHRLANDFPDGQIFLNLSDSEGRPRPPSEVLRHILSTLGIAAFPPDDDVRPASLYRSLLADRKVLIVLDNVHSLNQLTPILPANSACSVLVTSRNKLLELVALHGAHLMNLEPLSTRDGLRLLRALLSDDRFNEDLDAAKRIVLLCGGLPLALRIAAAQLLGNEQMALQTFADQLRDHRLDLLELSAGSATSLREAFDTSYRALTAEAALAFRHLGLHAERTVNPSALAALADIKVDAAARLLSELARVNLLTPTGARTFAMHDLVRLYARELANEDGGEVQRAALHRLSLLEFKSDGPDYLDPQQPR